MRISDWSSDVCSSDLHAVARDEDRDLRPLAPGALHGQLALVEIDEMARQWQAEAGAFVLAAERGVHLAEGRHRIDDVGLGHADAGLLHLQPQRAVMVDRKSTRLHTSH